jgi:hypothetical protein
MSFIHSTADVALKSTNSSTHSIIHRSFTTSYKQTSDILLFDRGIKAWRQKTKVKASLNFRFSLC